MNGVRLPVGAAFLPFLKYEEDLMADVAASVETDPKCKIWGFHGGDYEEWYLLGCYAVCLL
jgi:hypothetical protein